MGTLSELGNNQTQDILDDMGMLDENGCGFAHDYSLKCVKILIDQEFDKK